MLRVSVARFPPPFKSPERTVYELTYRLWVRTVYELSHTTRTNRQTDISCICSPAKARRLHLREYGRSCGYVYGKHLKGINLGMQCLMFTLNLKQTIFKWSLFSDHPFYENPNKSTYLALFVHFVDPWRNSFSWNSPNSPWAERSITILQNKVSFMILPSQ